MVDFSEMYAAYKDCAKNKRTTASCKEFEMNLYENINKLVNAINDRTYKPGDSNCFVIRYPKPREIFAANFADRVIHHFLILRLNGFFEQHFINEVFNCRVGKGTFAAYKQIYKDIKEASNNYTKTTYVMKCDFKAFFMNINKEILLNLLLEFIDSYVIYDVDMIKWLTSVLINDTPETHCRIIGHINDWCIIPDYKSLFVNGPDNGLPIGNLTSQIFANFLLMKFDKFVKFHFLYYGRYVDDFYIISNDKEKLINFINPMIEYLNSIHVILHPDKIYIQEISKGVKFLGRIIKPNRVYIGNHTFYNFKNALLEWNNNICLDNIENFISSINSYLGYLSNDAKSYYKRKEYIDLYLDKNWFNYITINESYSKVELLSKYKLKVKLNKLDMNYNEYIFNYPMSRKRNIYNKNKDKINNKR